jgi:FixJ family two-component response regulator
MPIRSRPKAIVHLIDADEAIRDSTQLLLQTTGIEVYAYSSAIEFLIDANLQEIGCLVLDANLPNMTGIELLDQIRRDNIRAPAVFTTARGNSADLRAAAARTGAAVLLKPFNPDQLVAHVKNALGKPEAT